MKLVKKLDRIIKDFIILSLIEESFSEKINNLKITLLSLAIISFLFASGYSYNNKELYSDLVKLFSILSNVYAILLGFIISPVVFIVSYLFKESFNFKEHDNQYLRVLYKQVVNSFMLSTFNNLAIIILGVYHLIVVKTFNLITASITLPFYINKVLNIFYLNIWLFLIFTSIIVFIRCLVILTRLLRLSENNI